MVRSLIFDMDGTLFQTETILELALDDAFTQLGAEDQWDSETPIQMYRDIMGVPLEEVWKTLLPDHSNDVRERINEYFQKKLIDHIYNGKGALYPHVQDVLHNLKKQNYELYIASNGLTDYLNAIVDYYQLDQWITETFSIERIQTLHKSDLVKEIGKKYKLTKTAVIGDRLSDIRAAKDNGFIAIGCNFDFAQENELAEADFVINHFLELQPILSKVHH